jgi:hypothetical protein
LYSDKSVEENLSAVPSGKEIHHNWCGLVWCAVALTTSPVMSGYQATSFIENHG